jgi:hypothetical protein
MKFKTIGIAYAAGLLTGIIVAWYALTTEPAPRFQEDAKPDPVPKSQWIFLMTFDHPEGAWLRIVDKDETPHVQHWWQGRDKGYFLVLHESGKLTKVFPGQLEKLINQNKQ